MSKAIGLRLVILVPLAVFLNTTVALAADPVSLTVQAPRRMILGDQVEVVAVLTDNQGRPIPGADILLTMPGDFLSVERDVELDRATTDALGTARLRFQARTEKATTLTASFPGNRTYGASQASTEVVVNGTMQLYVQTAGVRLPGIGVWLLVGVLGVAWSIYVGVMALVTLIARAGVSGAER